MLKYELVSMSSLYLEEMMIKHEVVVRYRRPALYIKRVSRHLGKTTLMHLSMQDSVRWKLIQQYLYLQMPDPAEIIESRKLVSWVSLLPWQFNAIS